MADYFPLIANPVGNLITELPANNNLNLANSSIINAVSVQSVGNITGNYFIGNGSLLTGIDATSIQNGTSNVRVVSAGGNVAVGINGTSNVVVTANTGVYVTGLVSATGQVTSSQFNGSGAGLSSVPGANVTGTVPAATVAATVTTAAQPNITSVGTLSSLAVTGNITGGNLKTGNITIDTDTIRSANATLTLDPAADGVSGLVVIAGNLQVTGTTTTVDSTTITTNDLMINVANNAATSSAANGGGLGVGPVGTEYVKLYWDSAGNTWDSTHGISAVGTVTATSFTGSGAGLTSLTGANVTGTVANATYAVSAGIATSATTSGTVTTAAQPNITSVGTLTSLAVTGNISGGNVNSTFFGSGAGLSSIPGANVTGTVASATSAATAATAGTVTGNAQANITSVGTLTSLAVTGNVTAGNLSGTSIVGTLTTASQTNITGVGNLTTGTWSANTVGIAYGGTGKTTAPAAMAALMGYTATATAAGTTVLTNTSSYYQYFTGTSTQTVTLPVTSTLQTGWTFHIVNNSTGNITVQSSGANTVIVIVPGTTAMVSCIGTALTTAADWESGITDFSTYTGTGPVVMATSPTLTTPNIGAASATTLNTTGAITVNTGQGATAIINGTTNGFGNIGASGAAFNTIFAKATSAQYADLAEKYTADADYEPGTVLIFGGEQEVTMSTGNGQQSVAGVVSTNPAYIMNSELLHEHVVIMALTGRTPVKVIGPVSKGDFMISAANGYAQACADPKLGTVIGKAIENFNGVTGIVEVLINNH